MKPSRLKKQIEFIREIDKLKSIFRKTLLMDGKRYENDAEHSWHVCVMAVLLSEYANKKINLLRVIKMLLFHDIVEIYAGDTFCYDEKAAIDQLKRETAAARRIYRILPDDQRKEFYHIWREFDAKKSPEAKYAAALDRLHPILHNYATKGAAWRENGVTEDKVMNRNKHMGNGAKDLWVFTQALIMDAVRKGYLPKTVI